MIMTSEKIMIMIMAMMMMMRRMMMMMMMMMIMMMHGLSQAIDRAYKFLLITLPLVINNALLG